jgi:dihydroorotate dehydrogenase
MIGLLERIGRPMLRAMDPEDAHALVLGALRFVPVLPAREDAALAVEAFGIKFPNPIGIAAGLDKNAVAFVTLLRLGFGFVEVGTVTPRPQAGNPRPRLFRLSVDAAVINRLGFNNDGFEAVHRRLARKPRRAIVAVNVGANADAADRMADYVSGIAAFADMASFITINVSSPNTPRLRSLQNKPALDELMARVIEARDAIGRPPVLLKIAPDLGLSALDDIVAVARSRRVDGLIVSNTTLARPGNLHGKSAAEPGGLSGRPLFALSTRMLAETYVRVEGAFPLIGVGGIDSGETAFAKVKAGASLVELYTGLVFRGLSSIGRIKSELTRLCRREGYANVRAAVGADATSWTQTPWPL